MRTSFALGCKCLDPNPQVHRSIQISQTIIYIILWNCEPPNTSTLSLHLWLHHSKSPASARVPKWPCHSPVAWSRCAGPSPQGFQGWQSGRPAISIWKQLGNPKVLRKTKLVFCRSSHITVIWSIFEKISHSKFPKLGVSTMVAWQKNNGKKHDTSSGRCNIMPYQWWCVLPCRKSFAFCLSNFKSHHLNTDSDAIGPQRLQKYHSRFLRCQFLGWVSYMFKSSWESKGQVFFGGVVALGGYTTLRFPWNQNSNLQETSFIHFVKGLRNPNAGCGSWGKTNAWNPRILKVHIFDRYPPGN